MYGGPMDGNLMWLQGWKVHTGVLPKLLESKTIKAVGNWPTKPYCLNKKNQLGESRRNKSRFLKQEIIVKLSLEVPVGNDGLGEPEGCQCQTGAVWCFHSHLSLTKFVEEKWVIKSGKAKAGPQQPGPPTKHRCIWQTETWKDSSWQHAHWIAKMSRFQTFG